MERKLVGVLFAIFGPIFWAVAAAATPAGTVIGVSGSCTDHGHVLSRGDAVQIGHTLDVPADVAGPSTFEVSTAVGTASVSSNSADWFIKAKPDSAQVAVLAGTVDLTSTETGQSVSIPARWGTRLETGLDPVLPRVWAQGEFNAVIRLTGA